MRATRKLQVAVKLIVIRKEKTGPFPLELVAGVGWGMISKPAFHFAGPVPWRHNPTNPTTPKGYTQGQCLTTMLLVSSLRILFIIVLRSAVVRMS